MVEGARWASIQLPKDLTTVLVPLPEWFSFASRAPMIAHRAKRFYI